MPKELNMSLDQLSPYILTVISRGQKVQLSITGGSMRPLLYPNRDSVVLAKVEILNKLDVVLFKREDNTYVLHRIVKVEGEQYRVVGDGTIYVETVQSSQILAKVDKIVRKSKSIETSSKKYRVYSQIWEWLRPLRRILIKVL